MVDLTLLSNEILQLMWKELRRNTDAPLCDLVTAETFIENEYYSRVGRDIKQDIREKRA